MIIIKNEQGQAYVLKGIVRDVLRRRQEGKRVAKSQVPTSSRVTTDYHYNRLPKNIGKYVRKAGRWASGQSNLGLPVEFYINRSLPENKSKAPIKKQW